MPGVTRQFSDLDFDFIPHPLTGDINILKGVDAVKRAVRNLVLSAVYERPFRPNLGSGVRQYLFEPINPLTKASIETAVMDVLRIFEPRVTIIKVIANVNADENGYDLTVTFAVDNESQIASIDVFLERIR